MAGILDDLKGVLDDASIAKIEANAALKTRITRGDELRSWYDGEEPPAPAAAARVEEQPPAPARREPPPGVVSDLTAIERMLDTKLGSVTTGLDDRIKNAVTQIMTTEGEKFRKSTLAQTHQLVKINQEHIQLTGKPLDEADFNTFLEKPENAGRFRTIPEAYAAYTEPQARAAEIAKGVEDGIKARSGSAVPGTTPGPGNGNKTIEIFRKRGTAAEGGAMTGAQRAAAALDAKMAQGA